MSQRCGGTLTSFTCTSFCRGVLQLRCVCSEQRRLWRRLATQQQLLNRQRHSFRASFPATTPSSQPHGLLILACSAVTVMTEYVFYMETPPIQCSSGPSAPTNVQTVPSAPGTWRTTWTDGSASVPVETYKTACFASPSCTGSPLGTPGTNIQRGVQTGLATGLPIGSGPFYCYVIASNGVGAPVCSAPVTVPL